MDKSKAFAGLSAALPLFLRKLTAPVEVKLVLAALDEEKRQIVDSIPMDVLGPVGSSLGFYVVKRRVAERIFKSYDDITKLIAEGKPPRAVALWGMMSVARDNLYIGTYHLGRGRLSMPGLGVHALSNYCCHELEKLGQITPEEGAAMIQATSEEVRAVG